MMRKETSITTQSTDQNFDYWLHRPYVDDNLRAYLSSANLLIVPREDYPGHDGPLFPQGTDQLLDFLKEYSVKGVVPEACISDDDYNDLTLHHDLFEVGTLVVQNIVAPVAVALILNYVNKSRPNKPEIKVTLTVVEADSSARQLTYEGPVDSFQSTVNQALASSSVTKDVTTASPVQERLTYDEPERNQETIS